MREGRFLQGLLDTARAPPGQVVWSCRAVEAKGVQKEKHCWSLDVFSPCLKRHELKELVLQLKMSFRSLRVMLTLLCLFFAALDNQSGLLLVEQIAKDLENVSSEVLLHFYFFFAKP